MLLGASGLQAFFSHVSGAVESVGTTVAFGMQTNATLVDDDIVAVLQEFDVKAGVSLDGPQPVHDSARVDAHGRGTFDRVLSGVRALQEPRRGGRGVFGGFLCVANPAVAPSDAIRFFSEDLAAPAVDFLLPDFNHDTYPHDLYPVGTFGEWLAAAFDAWINSDSRMAIRSFYTIMKLILGGEYGYDAMGARAHGVVVVETDGSYHLLDALKTTYHGVTHTGKSVRDSDIGSLEEHPLIVALSDKARGACSGCLSCPYFAACGGGYLPHRYSAETGFQRESVYCEDLKILFDRVRKCVATELSRVRRPQGIGAKDRG
jgi:uncharacterized protein